MGITQGSVVFLLNFWLVYLLSEVDGFFLMWFSVLKSQTQLEFKTLYVVWDVSLIECSCLCYFFNDGYAPGHCLKAKAVQAGVFGLQIQSRSQPGKSLCSKLVSASQVLTHVLPSFLLASLSASHSLTMGFRKGDENQGMWIFKCLGLESEDNGNGVPEAPLEMNYLLVQPLWRTSWRVPPKLKIELPCDPAIPFLSIYMEEMKSLSWRAIFTPHIHYSIIHDSQDVETA